MRMLSSPSLPSIRQSLVMMLLILMPFCLQAQDGSTSEEDSWNHLFWKIEGQGLKNASYLYGTIHVIPKDSFYLDKSVTRLFKKADKIVMEIDPSEMQSGGLGALVNSFRGMLMPKDTSLQSLIGDQAFLSLQRFMKDSIDTPFPLYQRMRPIYISQYISTEYCTEEELDSYEIRFMEMAEDKGIPIIGLETATEQADVLNSISLTEQAEMLTDVLSNPQKSCEQMEEMVSLYRRQDLIGLSELIGEADEFSERMDNALLRDRNQNWIPKLADWMNEESLFIAVGAGHLIGPDGLIVLLRNMGYTVSPVI
ncbi:TraB/GumN family protein [Pontibacter sp. G13]|uniref:TraB/GumN family protein n=1 Tax=Pontibacter sp. G13 TaxID=3074898 RepID=UPI00288B1FA2|nr:TraB/GumN family protein [Pontibacter sp. G13]WNJ18566.1 TraB/GumN family protein [Pontibacter sp. G13]